MDEPETWAATYDLVLVELAARIDRWDVESAIEAAQAALARNPGQEERMLWTIAVRVLGGVLMRYDSPSATIH